MKRYRSGHNEADSKSVGQLVAGTWVRIPLASPIYKEENKLDKEKKKQMIKLCVAITTFAIIILLVGMSMIRYQVEGDKNMPFNLSKIIVVSTAEGQETEGKQKWNFKVYQNNDVYIYIDKNENYKGEEKTIKSVKIENINVTKAPSKGEIKTYMPNSVEGRIFDYKDEYIVNDKLEYKGAEESNPETLEIGSNGGSLILSFSNTGLDTYSSDKDKQITHDGTLLEKIKVTNEDIAFDISFDIVITVDNCSYRANVAMQMPCGNIIEEGTCNMEKTDMSDVIFKRE
jgi:hypothetical protein